MSIKQRLGNLLFMIAKKLNKDIVSQKTSHDLEYYNSQYYIPYINGAKAVFKITPIFARNKDGCFFDKKDCIRRLKEAIMSEIEKNIDTIILIREPNKDSLIKEVYEATAVIGMIEKVEDGHLPTPYMPDINK